MRESQLPPTENQLTFIDELLYERDTENLFVRRPATREEASALIDALLACPFHKRGLEDT